MRSRILGTSEVDQQAIAQAVETVARAGYRDEYSEYAFGMWRSYVLANGSGEQDDGTFRPYEGTPQLTELGKRLPYIYQLVQHTFNTESLKWIRIFAAQDGLPVSHRDFVEFDRQFFRLHLPIRTDLNCLHSEEETVFHMRLGEIWYLDASVVHSMCNLSGTLRLAVCLDFARSSAGPETLLKERSRAGPLPDALVIEREPMSEEFLEALHALGGALNDFTFRDIVRLLGKVHFHKQAHAAACFDWLLESARRSGDPRMVDKASRFQRYCCESRQLGERFQF